MSSLKKWLPPAIASLPLAGCATAIQPLNTLRWRGKDSIDYIVERTRRLPDTAN